MLLVPSITISKGKIILYSKGDFSHGKIYDQSPIELAKSLEGSGIKRLHIVDLDGAKKGRPVNDHLAEMIAGHTNLNINYSGGVHTDGAISKIFETGVKSVTCATMSVYQPELFSSWLMSYGGNKIVLAADTLDGFIRVGGWLKKTQISLFDHVSHFHMRGLKYLKTTDISRDGSMEGPSFDLYKELIDKFPNLKIFASGGIRNMKDVYKLKEAGVAGTLIGKCFFEEKITLAEIEKYNSEN